MIYFITAREIGRVKIGFSEEPRSRFVKMRTDSPIPLTLERICEGGVEDERALHSRFANDRYAGEWFMLSSDIEDHMASLDGFAMERKRKQLRGPLGRWLLANGKTLGEAAVALGTTQASMSRLCRCKQEPSFAMMTAILEYTNGEVTPSDIVAEWSSTTPSEQAA